MGDGAGGRWARGLRLAGFLGAGFLVASLLWVGVPWILLKVGIGTGYEVGLVRWGRAEYRHRFGAEESTVRTTVGWAWGRAGESLRVRYELAADEGAATLVVDGLTTGASPAWRHRVEAGDTVAGDTLVTLPDTDLYHIRLSRRGFHGRAEVAWGFP